MDLHLSKRLLETIFLAVVLVMGGCTALGTPVGVKGAEEGKMTVHIKASSFEYRPNNIKVPEPGPLTLVVENLSGIEHNITVKNPEGQVLKTVNLPPKKTTSASKIMPFSVGCLRPHGLP